MDYILPKEGFAYRDHQLYGIQWMKQRETERMYGIHGGFLADEMGLGKTWMTIGLILNSSLHHTLLLVPPILQSQWHTALLESSIPHRMLQSSKWTSYTGTKSCMVSIASYAQATLNIGVLLEDAFDRIVCDEGHSLRNARTKKFEKLSKIPATSRWIISGTPVQNRKDDFKNLCLFLGISDTMLEHHPLKGIASHILLRRTVKEVYGDGDSTGFMSQELPLHVIHSVVMPEDGEEQFLFRELVQNFKNAIKWKQSSMVILELYLRIQQFLAHPSIYIDAINKKDKDTKCWTDSASKMSAFRHVLTTTEKKPTIVFANFRTQIQMAKRELQDAGFYADEIHGGIPTSVRDEKIHKSKQNVENGIPTALVIQIMTGNAGLNLQHMNRVMFISSHWNPSVVDQAIGRSYRMGQKDRVEVHHFLLADNAERNLDRIMAQRHGKKRKIALNIHPKLYTESAIDDETIIHTLDKIWEVNAPVPVPAPLLEKDMEEDMDVDDEGDPCEWSDELDRQV